MKSSRTHSRRLFAGRLLLAAMWFTAGYAKLHSLDELTTMVRAIFIGMGSSLALWPALALIAFEAMLGIALLFSRTAALGLVLSVVAGLLFLAVNTVRLLDNIHAPCSCFGALYTASPQIMGGIDLIIILFSATLLRLQDRTLARPVLT